MTSKTFVSLLAILARRRVVATALVYGLSMTVHFTSAAGEKPEAPTAAAIMASDGAQILPNESPAKSVPPIASHRDWPLGSARYRAACESPRLNIVDAAFLLTSIEAPASLLHVLARRRSQEACRGSHGGDARTSEEV